MAWAVDPNTGRIVQVPDTPVAPGATPTGEQLYAQGLQTAQPAGVAPDVPIMPGQTWPLQPLQLSPGVVPDSAVNATPARTASQLAGQNQTLAASLTSARPEAGILQPAQRGNYNMYNTDTTRLAKPVGAGLNFGFGVNGSPTAAQYLQTMAVQDGQRTADRERRALTREYLDAQSRLTPSASIGEIAAARGRIAALAPILGQQTAIQGQANVANTNAQAAASDAATRLEGVQLQAEAEVLSRLAAAQLTGQYGVAAAQARGNSALQKAQLAALTPEGRKAAAEAALAETRLNVIRQGVNDGTLDAQGVIAATRSGQEPQARVYINPITGAPLSEAEIRLLQEQQLQNLQPQ